jgi:hypothetical protein
MTADKAGWQKDAVPYEKLAAVSGKPKLPVS